MSKKKQNALQQALAGRTSIGSKGIANIKAELGIKSGVKRTAKDLGIKIKSSSSRVPSSLFGPSTGSTPAEFDFKSALGLVNAQGNIDTQIARLNSEAASNVARIKADSDVDVENIRSTGAINLQRIMNEGNERVENIRGTFGLRGKGIDRGTAILSSLASAFNF
jgi:hypothetical protein